MHDANIITLYKNKGDGSDCHNYHGISLLSIVGKAFPKWCWTGCRCLLSMFTQRHSVDSVLEDWQSTWSSHYISSKRSAMRRGDLFYIIFIDLSKAFDLVSRKGLFTLLQRIGCSPKLLGMITSFHEGMQDTLQHDGSSLDPFPIRNGVKQGYILAPRLFGIFFYLLLPYTFSQSEDGIYLCIRRDGSLFSHTCLWAKSKVQWVLIRELLFVNDTALSAHTEEALQ